MDPAREVEVPDVERFPPAGLAASAGRRCARRWRVLTQPVAAALGAAVLLTSCNASASSDEARASTSSVTTSVATNSSTVPGPGVLRIGEQATTKEGNVVKVLTYQQSLPSKAVEPDPGTEFAAVEAEICAGPSSAARVSAEGFKVEMADGDRRGRSFFGPKEPVLTEGRVMPGACARGWVNFEVPRGKRPAYVVFQGSSLARWAAGGTR